MKHLKTFENIEDAMKRQKMNIQLKILNKDEDDLDIGELCVLIKKSKDTKEFNFNIGQIYKISLTDYDDKLPYEISELNEDGGIWVRKNQIRRLTETEKQAIKYNL